MYVCVGMGENDEGLLMTTASSTTLYTYLIEVLPVHEPSLPSKKPDLQPHVNEPILLKQNS